MAGRLAYRPNIRSAREFGRHAVGKFIIVFYDGIVSMDVVQYEFVAVLFAEGEGEELLYFTSEKNNTSIPALLHSLGIDKGEGTGSHFFCMFDTDGHSNHGVSDDWADAAKFQQEVMRILEEGLSPAP